METRHWRRARRLGPLLVLLVAVAVVAGCASSTGGTGAAASSGSPVAPASSPTGPVARTFSPYAPDGSLAVSVAGRSTGYCWTTSIAAPAADTYRCFAGNLILDPCFAPPDTATPQSVVCLTDPWSTARLLTLTRPLPPAVPVTAHRAWALELANGARCVASTGTVVQVGGVALSYLCGTTTAAGPANVADPAPRVVLYGPIAGPLTAVGVTTIWRA